MCNHRPGCGLGHDEGAAGRGDSVVHTQRMQARTCAKHSTPWLRPRQRKKRGVEGGDEGDVCYPLSRPCLVQIAGNANASLHQPPCVAAASPHALAPRPQGGNKSDFVFAANEARQQGRPLVVVATVQSAERWGQRVCRLATASRGADEWAFLNAYGFMQRVTDRTL